MNTEKIRIQCFQGFETAFDGAVFVLPKDYESHTFLSLKDRNCSTSSYKK